MEITTRSLGSVRVLTVQGRIDHAHANAFEAALMPQMTDCSASGTSVVLDLSGVPFISSVGLRVLMLAAKQARAQKGRIAVAALTPIVAEVFHVSRFDLVLSVYESMDAAVAALAP